MSTSGKVYVGTIGIRESWAHRPDGCKNLNVTSMQAADNEERKDFSPMSGIPGGYHGFLNFEHYWQAGKRYADMSDKEFEEMVLWWQKQKNPTRRHPKSKGRTVVCGEHAGVKRDYVDSRKEVYVHKYYPLMRETRSFAKWKNVVNEGQDVVVYDFDGPRNEDGTPGCLEVTPDMLREKIHDTQHPFGHGYVVAAALLDITPDMYCK